MRLPGRQLILDTNILYHWCRQEKRIGSLINDKYDLFNRSPKSYVSIVSVGELAGLALHKNWGDRKQEFMDDLVCNIKHTDISTPDILKVYGQLYSASRKLGKQMGKNDLWIAATAKVFGSVILTTDYDFDHLFENGHIEVECLDANALTNTRPPQLKIRDIKKQKA